MMLIAPSMAQSQAIENKIFNSLLDNLLVITNCKNNGAIWPRCFICQQVSDSTSSRPESGSCSSTQLRQGRSHRCMHELAVMHIEAMRQMRALL